MCIRDSCYTGWKVSAGAAWQCRATLGHVVTPGTYEFFRLVEFIYADAVYYNRLTNRAALSCRTLRRVAGMCSSTLSDTANMWIYGRVKRVLWKKNPLPFPNSLSYANFAVLSQKETGFIRVETLVSTLMPLAVGTAPLPGRQDSLAS